MRISVIVPALNEEATIEIVLRALAPVRNPDGEILLVDGGSGDATVARGSPLADRVIVTDRAGRAHQMNAGARAATGDILWFVHADTVPDTSAPDLLRAAMSASPREWGHFGVRMSSTRLLLRSTAWLMNWRSCLTGIATGDQGILVRRRAFDEIGGFAEQPLMEDVELAIRLRRRGRPICLPVALTTSSRRWEAHGISRTILLMWRLRLAYRFGADPEELADRYRRSGE